MQDERHDPDKPSTTPVLVSDLDATETDACLSAILSADSKELGFTYAPQPVCLSLVHEGQLVGGLTGKINWGWLYIERLAIDANWRRLGFGKQLVLAAEELARRRDCSGVWVDTYTFQVPEFYLRLGYEQFGRLPNHPTGHSRVFFRKSLRSNTQT